MQRPAYLGLSAASCHRHGGLKWKRDRNCVWSWTKGRREGRYWVLVGWTSGLFYLWNDAQLFFKMGSSWADWEISQSNWPKQCGPVHTFAELEERGRRGGENYGNNVSCLMFFYHFIWILNQLNLFNWRKENWNYTLKKTKIIITVTIIQICLF